MQEVSKASHIAGARGKAGRPAAGRPAGGEGNARLSPEEVPECRTQEPSCGTGSDRKAHLCQSTSPLAEEVKPDRTDWFDYGPVASFVLDGSGSVAEANNAGVTLLGEEKALLVSRPFRDFVAPSSRERFDSHLGRVCATGEKETCEIEILRKDGKVHSVSLVTQPGRSEENLWCAANDITEQKEQELALRRNESECRLLWQREVAFLDAVQDPMYALDREGMCCDYRFPAAGKESLPSDDVRGRHISEILPLEAARAVWCCLQQASITGRTQVFEYSLNQSGRMRYFEGRVVVSGGDRFIFIAHDITDRRRAQEDTLRARNLESLSRVSGGIAHDFNNLLMAVGGYICLARMKTDRGSRVNELLTEAENMALAGKVLTAELMALVDGREQRDTIADMGVLAKKVCRGMTRALNRESRYFIQPDILPARINETRIRQAIRNVVANAVEAMPEGGTVTVRCTNVLVPPGELGSLNPGDYVKLSIEDEGSGIRPEDMERIFDPYFTTKGVASGRGTGLGLTACYAIMRKHGGCIAAESTPGKGSVFHLYFPVCHEYTSSWGSSGTLRNGEAQGKRKILIMNNRDGLRDVLGEILDLMGYHVVEVGDGFQAIKRYQEEFRRGRPFQAVILDHSVRYGMGNREAMRNLLRIDPDVKVILSTGLDVECGPHFDNGFAAIIAKPYNMNRIAGILRRVIQA